MTKIERVHAFRAPDGQLYATRDECRRAVVEAVVLEALERSFHEPTHQGVADFICRELDNINARVAGAMGAV